MFTEFKNIGAADPLNDFFASSAAVTSASAGSIVEDILGCDLDLEIKCTQGEN